MFNGQHVRPFCKLPILATLEGRKHGPNSRRWAKLRAQFRLDFQVPGVLETLCCHTGDTVRQGQLLATLRAGDADARLRAANASRAIAERDEATTSKTSSWHYLGFRP